MKFLFVSGTTTGGSGRSQRELAHQLVRRGHEVTFLVDPGQSAKLSRWGYGHLADASVRFESSDVAPLLRWMRNHVGRRVKEFDVEGLTHWASVKPQNALKDVIRAWLPDVVVVNSVERWAWRLIRATCARAGVPAVLYVREDDSLGHVSPESYPDLLIANAHSLTQSLRSKGFECSTIPSVVDVHVTATIPTRTVALAINPSQSRGGDIVWNLARALPEVDFVVQESWRLAGTALAEVEGAAATLANVEFRRAQQPGPGIYADARVLLVPYRVDNRPRVILEAQANGIPVLAGDVPALVEATGPGGICVPLGSLDAWVEALTSMWTDEHLYSSLCAAATSHAKRPEVDPERITDSFEKLVVNLISQET
ncbi:glycosyltransferase [Knoellia sp. S7-12]|uniref:glycosyltransferase n=1 Tax=Knoellia sp. S7-12 TaxID=3126698 RepID=UPI00336757E1